MQPIRDGPFSSVLANPFDQGKQAAVVAAAAKDDFKNVRRSDLAK